MQLVIIAHNLRSTHNVGSLLRTAEGLGVEEVILSGYTPYPSAVPDERLPHLAQKITKQINKTALGAENFQNWHQQPDIRQVFNRLKKNGYLLAALEQAVHSIKLPQFQPPDKLALVIGSEVHGLELPLLDLVDIVLEIPMFGSKESFNVVQATAMACYHCRFYPF